jgi:uncharacterized membrane protein
MSADTAILADRLSSPANPTSHEARMPLSPTVSPPEPKGLASALERNIHSLSERKSAEEKSAGLQERVAQHITRFAGSMAFVYIHAVVFGIWVLVNAGFVTFLPKWDESFVILGTSASVEAIFLSTFVLISQNRMAVSADKRADLDLQISLLSEHEVTRLVTLVSAIAAKMDIHTSEDDEIEELKRDVAPEAVLDELEAKAASTGTA